MNRQGVVALGWSSIKFGVGIGFDAGTHFFVAQRLALVEPFQPLLHLLAKPGVMVDVVFHQPLDVFLCAAVVLGSDTVEFRLQVRMKVYFHIAQYEQVSPPLSTT